MPAEQAQPIGTEPRYHVPRSQVWEGSRGGQQGNVHFHLLSELDTPRLKRKAGAALCGRRGWYEREPTTGEKPCPRCLDLAERYHVEVPEQYREPGAPG